MNIGLEAHRNVKLSPHLIQGTFIARINRFAALVKVCGRDVQVHVANSGRLCELLQPGMRVLLTPAGDAAHRKTAYDLSLVDLGHTLVSADAQLPSTLVYEALSESRLPQFAAYDTILREQVLENSRLDLLLLDASGKLGGPGKCYVEVRSVTLVEEGVGLFPDAPTTRGRRHVETLSRAAAQGCRAPPCCSSSSGRMSRPFTPTMWPTLPLARRYDWPILPAWRYTPIGAA